MPWTQPKTWSNEPLIAADMNTHIRDNLLILKEPVTDSYAQNGTISTTSTTFVSAGSNYEMTLVTNGGDVMIGFTTRLIPTTGSAYVDVEVDGVDYYSNLSGIQEGITGTPPNTSDAVGIIALITGLSAGSHTFKLKIRVTAGSVLFKSGQFWVREVS